MAGPAAGPPLRILLACARPLAAKVETWILTLAEGEADTHAEKAEQVLASVADCKLVGRGEKQLVFAIFPPRPDPDLLRKKLAEALPLKAFEGKGGAAAVDLRSTKEEIEVVASVFRASGKAVELVIDAAVTLDSLREHLRRKPGFDILHLVCHGNEEGVLSLEDGYGWERRLKPERFAELVRGKVKLVLNGACHGERSMAGLLNAENDGLASIFADGEHPIPTRAVERFAASFYPQLLSGAPLGEAFDAAVEAVRDDPHIGEAGMPDSDDGPSPWRRFKLGGPRDLAFPDVPGEWAEPVVVQKPTERHQRLPRYELEFVGRAIERAIAIEALSPPIAGTSDRKPPVVTFTGEGGIGKTSLAEAVTDWLAAHGRFPGGIFEINCEVARDLSTLAAAIAEQSGLLASAELKQPLRDLPPAIGRHAKSAGPTLLMLDNLDECFADRPLAATKETSNTERRTLNLEGRLASCSTLDVQRSTFDVEGSARAEKALPNSSAEKAPLLAPHPAQLLRACLTEAPDLRILATCRWPLGLGSTLEAGFELDPMAGRDACELFLAEIPDEDLRRDFRRRPREEQLHLLQRVIALTEGHPLSLVLLARRLERHDATIESLLDRAAKELVDLLNDPRLAGVPERLRSLHASMELSYNRLSTDAARRLFPRAACFPGGLYRPFDDLKKVLGDDWPEAAEELTRKALLRFDRDAQRYTMLAPIREYAATKGDPVGSRAFLAEVAQFWAGFAGYAHSLMNPSPDSALLKPLQDASAEAERQERLARAREMGLGLFEIEGANLVGTVEAALGNCLRSGIQLAYRLLEPLGLGARWALKESIARAAVEASIALKEKDLEIDWRGNLAEMCRLMGRYDEARREYEAMILDLRRRQASLDVLGFDRLATTLNNLGIVRRNLGEHEAARSHYEEALATWRQLASSDPAAFLPWVAGTLNNLGNLLAVMGERDEAQSHYDEALTIRRQLALENPAAFLPDLASTLSNKGNLLLELGELAAARAHIQPALGIYRQLASAHPAAFLPEVAMTLGSLGALLGDVNELDDARTALEEAVATFLPFARQYPAAFGQNLGIALRNLMRVYEKQGDEAELAKLKAAFGLDEAEQEEGAQAKEE